MQPLNESSQFGEQTVFRPTPSAISNLTTHKRSELDQGHNLGIYSNIRIDNYQGVNAEGRLIRLIYYDHMKNKFELDNTGMALLQRYSSYELGFVSILGEKQNGKSFILDKILNLSGVRGNHFSVVQQEGIWIWSQPYKKRNMKVFLVDCHGFTTQQVKGYEVKYAQILLLMSNVTLFNHRSRTNADDLSCFEWMLKDITKDIKVNGGQYSSKDQTISRSLQHIYRSQKLSRPSQQLSKYFQEYSFTYLEDAMTPGYQYKDSDLIQCSFLTTSCVNQRYIRHIAVIFKSIMGNLLERSFNDINFEGSIVIKYLNHILNRINSHEVLDVGVIFDEITKELYKSAFNYCILNYTQMLEKQFRNEEPKSMETLLNIFGNLRDSIIQTYNSFNLNQNEHQIYLEKLQQHIETKEAMLITVNKRKTQNILTQSFKGSNVTTSAQAVEQLTRFHQYRKDLDHGRDEVMIEFCKKLLESVVKSSDNLELQEQVENMKTMISDKQNELMNLKKKADELELIYNKEKESSMNNKSKEQQLDRKIEMEQQKQNALYKDNSHAMEEMERITSEYNEKIKNNQSEIDRLNDQIKQKTSVFPDKLDQNKRKAEEDELKRRDNQLKEQIEDADREIERLKSEIEKKHSKSKK